MGIYLDTRGRTTLGIGLCARCSRKMSLDDLYDDPNYPGLKVCLEDRDEFDPYRLPARQPEVISLRFARPDVPLETNPFGLPTSDDNYYMTAEDSQDYLEP